MKMNKLTAAIVAAITTAVPVTSGTSLIANTAAFAEYEEVTASLPDWIPYDLESVLQFYNEYGSTHIEDGLVCVVHKSGNPQMAPCFEVNGVYGDRSEYFVCGDEFELYPGADDSPYYMMSVFRPSESGTFTVSYKNDLGRVDYTFEADADMNITQTDIFGWLPDCAAEYIDYSEKNGKLSVRDNYVIFCLDYNSGTAYGWTENIADDSNIASKRIVDCTSATALEIGGAAVHDLVVYQPAGDGKLEISWDFGQRFGDAEPIRTLTADCTVFDNAQSVLFADTARFSIVDGETGELIDIDENDGIFLNPDIRYSTGEEGLYACVDLMSLKMTANPYYWNISEYKDADIFEIGLLCNNMPEGYTYDTVVRKFDNGVMDYVFKLKKTVSGDVNSDGQFNIADLVMLRNWMLGAGDAELSDWKAADLSKDGRINAYDFCLMRRLLAEKTPELEKAPAIHDDYGKVTCEQRAALLYVLSKMYPHADMSDFTFEYSPEHPLSYNFAGPCFYVYYKGILAHGYGDLNFDGNVFAAFDHKGNPTIELLIDPAKYKDIELAPENMLSEDEIHDTEYYPGSEIRKIIYFYVDPDAKPERYSGKLAYMLKDGHNTFEQIIDPVTGEMIELIPYYVPVPAV